MTEAVLIVSAVLALSALIDGSHCLVERHPLAIGAAEASARASDIHATVRAITRKFQDRVVSGERNIPFLGSTALDTRETDSDFYVRLVDGQPAWSSGIVLVECFSALLRKERERAISRAHRRRAAKQVAADVAARRLGLVPVTVSLVERAQAILEVCHPAVSLRSLDAIHLASAERCQSWPLCSNDARVRAAASKLGLPLALVAS